MKNIAQKRGRIVKLVSQGDIVELTGIIHRFRGQVWKRAVRSGHKLRNALSDMWIDVDSTVDGVYGNQQGAVASPRHGFGAHQCDLPLPCQFNECL